MAVGLEAFAVVLEADNVCFVVVGDTLAEIDVDDMNYYYHSQRKKDIFEHPHLPERHDGLVPDPAGRMCPGQSLYLAPALRCMLATCRPGSEAHSGLEYYLVVVKADNCLLLTF